MNDDAPAPGDADVLVVGAGLAGLTCGLFTARAGLDTVVLDGGPSILERNAHLENYPGFPGGVDARRLLGAVREQATDAGCELRAARAVECEREEGGTLRVETEDSSHATRRLVAASWSDASYLDSLAVETVDRGSKTFLEVDDRGRTSADGVYAAGRLAGRSHQAIVAAGHGAEVGVAIAEDADVDFYHDWVTPAGYFTGRGREVPPGCEEIDDVERREREAAGRARQRDLLDEPPTAPRQHPSVAADDED